MLIDEEFVVREDLFRDDEASGPPADDAMIARAEATLGVVLPESYKALCRVRNGGYLRLDWFPMREFTSHGFGVGVDSMYGIGTPKDPIDDQPGVQGSRYMIQEWGYPDLGPIPFDTIDGGHTAVMFDYRECGPEGEPSVVLIEEEGDIVFVAESFEAFIDGLVEDDGEEDEDEDL